MSKDRPTIGVTFFLHPPEKSTSIWNNGAMQNCVFLLDLLRASPTVGKVYAINAGHDCEPSDGLMLKGLGIEFVRIADVIDELDILIEAGGQISADKAARVRANGGRAIAYRFGNSFVIDMERILFKGAPGSIFNGTVFDEVWTNGQHMVTNADYWETVHRCPVRCLPHIWDSTFIDKAIGEMAEGIEFGYKPGAVAKRISVFEPNINVVKFCGVPLALIEQAHRRCSNRIEHVWITNAMHIKEHQTFTHFVGSLDIQKAKKVSFEGRFNTPWWLATKTDVVVSHQWECGLNYAYYDALYGGYPLLHNSDLLPDGVGYRYNGFQAIEGGRLLASVLMSHDSTHDQYVKRANAFLATVKATAPVNVEAHEKAIAEVFG